MNLQCFWISNVTALNVLNFRCFELTMFLFPMFSQHQLWSKSRKCAFKTQCLPPGVWKIIVKTYLSQSTKKDCINVLLRNVFSCVKESVIHHSHRFSEHSLSFSFVILIFSERDEFFHRIILVINLFLLHCYRNLNFLDSS